MLIVFPSKFTLKLIRYDILSMNHRPWLNFMTASEYFIVIVRKILLFFTLCNSHSIPQTNLPVFKVKESSVRRRYSDFEWLRNELERDSKVSNNPKKKQLEKNSIQVMKICDCVYVVFTFIFHLHFLFIYRLWCRRYLEKLGNVKCHSAAMTVYSMRILSKSDARALKVLSIK